MSTSEPTVYSQRLGAITDAQFRAACERLGLGDFVRAEPTTSGLFGQNVFLTTTTGEYVLRGAPHWVKEAHETTYWPQDQWQFSKETYFAHLLHERTLAPVPWPWVLERSPDIFGWPFIVMRRTPGHCFNQLTILRELEADARRAVAEAMADTLLELQNLDGPFAGDFDVHTIELAPFPGGFTQHVVVDVHASAASSERNGTWTPADQAWVDSVCSAALSAPERPITFVHGDYKLDNLTVMPRVDGTWEVTGVFDLHEARFGDGAYDLARQACTYLDSDRPLAEVFLRRYLDGTSRADGLEVLLPLYITAERLRIWDYFTRPPHRASWLEGKAFRSWVEPYVESLSSFLK